MQMYLALTSDTLQYTDFADYVESPPFAAPEGFQWVEGVPPENATPYKPKISSLADDMQSLFRTMPVSMQAQFAPLKAAIDLEVRQGNLDVAREIVNQVTAPSGYENLKEQIITLIGGA